MFSRPNFEDSIYLIADYIEYQCILTGHSVSSSDLRSLFSISDDEMDNNGADSSDDVSIDHLEEAIGECFTRSQLCIDRYPFESTRMGLANRAVDEQFKEIYYFLLLATRFNMKIHKLQDGEDATKLFEELCAEVVKEYFGVHSKSDIFGTASTRDFKSKMEDMISSLCLDVECKVPKGSTGKQKDGKLDVIAWIPFADKKDGQLVAMGQCKTGENWEEKLSEFQPDDFFNNYCTGRPYAKVVRLFFVTESFGDYKWAERSNAGGIVFDRTRIMEYLPKQMPGDLLSRIKNWNRGAIDKGKQMLD